MQQSVLNLVLAAAVSGIAASANLLPRQIASPATPNPDPADPNVEYLSQVCAPSLANNTVDLSAPCNIVAALTIGCSYGAKIQDELVNGCDDPANCDINNDTNPPRISNSTQRACTCESQFFPELLACEACMKAHGGTEYLDYYPDPVISSLSSSYCAASVTPTLALADYLFSYIMSNVETSTSSPSRADSTSSFTDPIGNHTAVSYYFTPSVTGTAAWEVGAIATSGSGSGGESSSSSSVRTSGGQIVPTATGDGAGGSSPSTAGSGASSSSTGAAATPKAEAGAVAGVLGFAALVAVL